MVDIASISHGDSSGLLYDIHHISKSVLRLIGEEHHITTHDEEASKSHGPSSRPLTSSTAIRMQPIQGRRKGRDGGRGYGRAGEECGGQPGGSTNETSISPPRLPYHTSITHC